MSNPDDVLKTSKHHSLRDRIANAIFLNVPADPIINSVECLSMADAVIEAIASHECREVRRGVANDE